MQDLDIKTMTVPMSDGSTVNVEYIDFAYNVQGEVFSLQLHRSTKEKGVTVIAHANGKRVTSMLNTSCNLYLEIEKGNAEKAMRDLIAKHGEARVRCALAGG